MQRGEKTGEVSVDARRGSEMTFTLQERSDSDWDMVIAIKRDGFQRDLKDQVYRNWARLRS